jgi:hypothetical protein
MDIHDWITISSVAIVVVGWFVNGLLNRQHEIAKKRMEYRLDALQSFLPAFFAITESSVSGHELSEIIEQANIKFQLYCYKDEIDAFMRLTNACHAQDNKAYTDAVRELARLVREGIRGELGLDAYEYRERV